MNIAKFLIFGFGIGLTSATRETPYVMSEKIINGITAEISAIPYQVALNDKKGRFHCGGSIISKNFILTAAHCVASTCLACEVINVRIGSAFPEKDGIVIKVKEIYTHPKYTDGDDGCEIDYDVAVLKLERAIPYAITAKPIALTEKEPRGQEVVQISGWGLTEPVTKFKREYKTSPVLQVVNTTVIHRALCQKMVDYFPFIGCPKRIDFTSRMFCVEGDIKGGCKGDSGGPVTFNNTQVGIVSWGWDSPEGACLTSPSGIVNIADPEIRNFINEKANLTLKILPWK